MNTLYKNLHSSVLPFTSWLKFTSDWKVMPGGGTPQMVGDVPRNSDGFAASDIFFPDRVRNAEWFSMRHQLYFKDRFISSSCSNY